MQEWQIKQQTPKHMAKMSKLVTELKDAGFDMEEIVDAGDYYLNLQTVEELNGTATKETNKKSTKKGNKKGKGKSVKDSEPTKGQSKAKSKATKGKGKKK